MIDTTDLTSYYPGYDEYCEPKEKPVEDIWDDADRYYEEMMLERMKEQEI